MTIEPTLNAAMDCTELERSIDAYLDGEFDAPERAEADVHLAACPRCRALVERQGRVRDAVRARLREAMAAPAAAGRAPRRSARASRTPSRGAGALSGGAPSPPCPSRPSRPAPPASRSSS